jgi:hypothetical protein
MPSSYLESCLLTSISPDDFESKYPDSYKPSLTFNLNPTPKFIRKRISHARDLGFNVVFSQNKQEFELRQDAGEELTLIDKDGNESVAVPRELAKSYIWNLRPIIAEAPSPSG